MKAAGIAARMLPSFSSGPLIGSGSEPCSRLRARGPGKGWRQAVCDCLPQAQPARSGVDPRRAGGGLREAPREALALAAREGMNPAGWGGCNLQSADFRVARATQEARTSGGLGRGLISN